MYKQKSINSVWMKLASALLHCAAMSCGYYCPHPHAVTVDFVPISAGLPWLLSQLPRFYRGDHGIPVVPIPMQLSSPKCTTMIIFIHYSSVAARLKTTKNAQRTTDLVTTRSTHNELPDMHLKTSSFSCPGYQTPLDIGKYHTVVN